MSILSCLLYVVLIYRQNIVFTFFLFLFPLSISNCFYSICQNSYLFSIKLPLYLCKKSVVHIVLGLFLDSIVYLSKMYILTSLSAVFQKYEKMSITKICLIMLFWSSVYFCIFLSLQSQKISSYMFLLALFLQCCFWTLFTSGCF